MKRMAIGGGFTIGLLLFLAGCASNGGLETQMKQLREDLRKEIGESEGRSGKNMGELESKTRKDMASLAKTLQGELSELKVSQNKYSMETDKTLLDQQKQIFQQKAFLDDNARRVYMLESIVTTKNVNVSPQLKEGRITFIEKKKVAISLGSTNGIKTGDKFSVHNNNEKIGTVKIEAVGPESSQGTILESRRNFSIGDQVEQEKQ